MLYQYPKIDEKRTGERIRQKCKEKGLSVAQIQRYLFIGSNQAVYSWFTGRTLPKIDTMYALACLLGVKIDDLIVKAEETNN